MQNTFQHRFLFNWSVVLTVLTLLFSSSGTALAYPKGGPSAPGAAEIQSLPGTWYSITSPTTNSLWSVSFSSPSSGWAGGSKVLLRYTGGSWQTFSAPALGTDFVVLSISMSSDSNGWLVGYAKLANPFYDTVILHWDGSLWNSVALPPSFTFALLSVSTVDDNNVYTSGGATLCNAPPVCDDLIGWAFHRSGSAWTTTGVGDHRKVYDLAMTGNDDGWIVGNEKNIATSQYQSLLMRWVAGSWQRVTTPSMNSSWLEAVSTFDANHAWAVGGYATIAWNGSAWSLVPFSWTVTPQVLHDVQAVSANDAWMVGDAGTILHWDGATLELISSPVTAGLYAVAKSSPTELWAVGVNGTILHYQPASLTANNPSGAPGSYFNLSAAGFAPGQVAVISVNGHVLQNTTTDGQGSLAVTLTTAGIEEGAYIVNLTVGLAHRTTILHINNSNPTQPQVGSLPTVAVPAGIAFTHTISLPAIFR